MAFRRLIIACAAGSCIPVKWCMSNQTMIALYPHKPRSSTYRCNFLNGCFMIEIKEMGRKIYPAQWLFRYRGSFQFPEGEGTLVISIASQEFPNAVEESPAIVTQDAHFATRSVFYAKAFVPDALLDAEFDTTGSRPIHCWFDAGALLNSTRQYLGRSPECWFSRYPQDEYLKTCIPGCTLKVHWELKSSPR